MGISTNKLAKKLNIKQEELIKKFIVLGFLKDKNILRPKGKEAGGELKKYMGSTYINWSDEDKIVQILSNKSQNILTKTIKRIIFPAKKEEKKEEKKVRKTIQRTSQKEKIAKGEIYEEFIALVYKANGYTIWEHGKDKGVLDGGIDLIVKKDKKIILIQCKNWNEVGQYKIDHKDIKAFRSDGRDFIEKNKIFKGYNLHLKYILSGNFMHPSAIHHIEECGKNISYEIIRIPTVD